MKKPWLAFILNYVFPGAGLAYLGKWGWALLNFVVAFAVAFVLVSVVPSDSLRAACAGLGAACGALAMSVAAGMNARANARPLGPPANPSWQSAAPAPPPYVVSPVIGSGPASAAPPDVVPTAASPRAKFCGACGAEAGGAKFCPECGGPIRPANQCPGCGVVLYKPAKFCLECGHAMV